SEARSALDAPGAGNRVPTSDRADRTPALRPVDTAFNVGRPGVRADIVDHGNDGREAIATGEGEAQLVRIAERVGAVERTERRAVAQEAGVRGIRLTEAERARTGHQFDEALVQVSSVAVAGSGSDRTARKRRTGGQEAVVEAGFSIAA